MTLAISGSIALSASEAFTRKNLNRSHAENVAAMRKRTALHIERDVPVTRLGVMAIISWPLRGIESCTAAHHSPIRKKLMPEC